MILCLSLQCICLQYFRIDTKKPIGLRASGEQWSGEATRGGGFAVEDARVDVTIGDENADENPANRRKERPIWMMESTVTTEGAHGDASNSHDSILDKAASTATNISTTNNKQGEDIMSVLLAHEKKGGAHAANAVKAVIPQESSDSSDNEESTEMQAIDAGTFLFFFFLNISKVQPRSSDSRMYILNQKFDSIRISVLRDTTIFF